VAGLAASAGAQTSPPVASRPSAAAPGTYRLGVSIQPVAQWNGRSWVPHGLKIVGVSRGSPGERAGLQTGNVVTSVNGTRVTSGQELQKALDSSGGQATLVVQDSRGYTSRQVPSFSWAPAVARSSPPAAPYAPSYAPSSGTYGPAPPPRRVIQRPYYGNYGDAPSPNPFSTPPSYGNVVVP
jgi:membrane-associated protease RseP (regulator of RpoE activity)